MTERPVDIDVAAQISRLYELSLSIGTSLGLAEMCQTFSRTAMSRLGLASVSVWVPGERMQGRPQTLVRAFASPTAGMGPDELPVDHPVTRMMHERTEVSMAFDDTTNRELVTEEVFDRGVVTMFRLHDVGLLRMIAAGDRQPLQARELSQLRSVMDVFAVAVDGCLDHRDLIHAVAARQKAERVLRESEERLELALAGANLGCWDWNVATGEVHYDERWTAMLGYRANELEPHISTWERLVHPDDRPLAEHALTEHLEGRRSWYETEHRLQHRDGHWVWVLDRGQVLRWDSAGRPLRAAGTHLDITARRQSEARTARLGLLREITSEILNAFLETDDINRAVDLILERCGTFLEVSRVSLFRYRENLSLLSNTHEWCAEGVESRREQLQDIAASSIPMWRKRMIAGQSICVNDVDDPEVDHDLQAVMKRQGIRALLALPVTIHGNLEGFFGFDEINGPRVWREEETALLSVIVEAYARAVERTIAQRNQAESNRLLAEALDVAEQASRAQASFLARMSHEIRTPLFGIIGLSNALARTQLDGRQREQIAALTQSAKTLQDIIGDILDFSKLKEKKTAASVQDVPLRDLLEGLAQTYAASARAKGVALYCDLAPDLPATIRSDPTHLRQVMGNLLANAIKFTGEGSVTVGGALESGAGGSVLVLQVADTGVGIPAESLPQIFEPFAQVDTSTRRRFEGTGLGLAIVSQLVELMGGSIDVQSTLGEGSTFTCRLPLNSAATGLATDDRPLADRIVVSLTGDDPRQVAMVAKQLAAIGVLRDGDGGAAPEGARRVALEVAEGLLRIGDGRGAVEFPLPVRTSTLADHLVKTPASPGGEPAPEAPREAASAGILDGRRILVVEDNEINRMVIADLLQHWGCRPVMAEDGDAGLAAHAGGDFDVILTDIQLPDRDGYDVAREIRRREIGTDSRVPIIALTAHALAEVQRACREAGMDDYVPKPLDEQRLLKAITDHLPAAPQEEAKEPDADSDAPAPTADTAEEPADDGVDRSYMQKITRGNATLARRLIETFSRNAATHVADIRSAVAHGDSKTLHTVTHGLKGAAFTIGARRVGEIARDLEQADAMADGDAIGIEVDRLADAIDRAVAALGADIDTWVSDESPESPREYF
jgi:PAS domain S-box-containing protein